MKIVVLIGLYSAVVSYNNKRGARLLRYRKWGLVIGHIYRLTFEGGSGILLVEHCEEFRTVLRGKSAILLKGEKYDDRSFIVTGFGCRASEVIR